MLKSKQRLLELNSKLADALTIKGIQASADETTTALVDKVSDISSGDDGVLASLIDRSVESIVIPDVIITIGASIFRECKKLTSITIPNSVTSIGNSAFYGCRSLSSITIPDGVTSIGDAAFVSCLSLTSITIPNGIKRIGTSTFASCTSLTSITIPNSVTSIGNSAFSTCSSLTSIKIPNSVTNIGTIVFSACINLEFVELGQEFNANNLDLSASTKYSRETILQWLNALADRTGQTAYKLTIGKTNLAKLTEEDIAIATAKNWTLA